MLQNNLISEYHKRDKTFNVQTLWTKLHLDHMLLSGMLAILTFGLVILYSATNANLEILHAQLTRIAIAIGVMLICAQIPPHSYKRWAPYLYSLSLVLLIVVLFSGHIGKGAQRWLTLGVVHFQPAELLKLALPMMLAFYLSEHPLPPKNDTLIVILIMIIVPVLLTAKQPDLGTAILIAGSGGCVLLLAAISWRAISSLFGLCIIAAPALWYFMHDYQRQRVLTFLDPERDPLGNGYHIIQSKIAIGSGGLFGKGWLHGTQAHLAFLPEHATDFIFAVCGEEFGLLGGLMLLLLYLFVTLRCLHISSQAQDTFTRLLAGTLSLFFFIAVFVNIGMVTGILPVVGVPLPLISYGGTSIVTILASFGILMSIHTHRKLISS